MLRRAAQVLLRHTKPTATQGQKRLFSPSESEGLLRSRPRLLVCMHARQVYNIHSHCAVRDPKDIGQAESHGKNASENPFKPSQWKGDQAGLLNDNLAAWLCARASTVGRMCGS